MVRFTVRVNLYGCYEFSREPTRRVSTVNMTYVVEYRAGNFGATIKIDANCNCFKSTVPILKVTVRYYLTNH